MKMYGVGVDVNVFMCVPTSLSQSLVTVKSGGVVCFVLYFKWVVYFVLYFMLVICFVLYFKYIICFVLRLKCGLFVCLLQLRSTYLSWTVWEQGHQYAHCPSRSLRGHWPLATRQRRIYCKLQQCCHVLQVTTMFSFSVSYNTVVMFCKLQH